MTDTEKLLLGAGVLGGLYLLSRGAAAPPAPPAPGDPGEEPLPDLPRDITGLSFGKLISPELGSAIIKASETLGFDANWIATAIAIERGTKGGTKLGKGVYHNYTDSDGVKHTGNFSYGLIGLLPGTAKWLGTTPEALYNMSDVEQMEYFIKYFQKHEWDKDGKKPIASFDDLYMGIFYGQKGIDADLYDVLISKVKTPKIYEDNKQGDINKDGYIRKKEILTLARKMYRKGADYAL